MGSKPFIVCWKFNQPWALLNRLYGCFAVPVGIGIFFSYSIMCEGWTRLSNTANFPPTKQGCCVKPCLGLRTWKQLMNDSQPPTIVPEHWEMWLLRPCLMTLVSPCFLFYANSFCRKRNLVLSPIPSICFWVFDIKSQLTYGAGDPVVCSRSFASACLQHTEVSHPNNS